MSFILLLSRVLFGKPTAQKISNNEACRNWDPTDSNPNNPWHTYSETTEENEQQENVQKDSSDIVVEVENDEVYNNYIDNI